jgi:subfamily B ATP-binding cassette protein MsbA
MVFKISDLESELDQSSDSSNATFGRAKGLIRFEDVCFSYPNADKRDAAIRDLNLTIQPGEVIALVGPSGGGKTTFINLLLGFFTPTSGSIFLDDIRLDGLALRDLRKQFSYVGQDTVLFNDTVMSNVAYGVNAGQIDRQAVLRALEAANLSSFMRELPNGLDTVIGDNGNQLSGGQRQRLAIARAIYKNAPIIILDEATSALDSESERQVQSALNHLLAGRTSIVIAHRLSTIEHANRIAVLKGGQIIEFGSHDELINLSGVYANLHNLQRLRTDSAQ